ncbi:MAG TPA: HAMP domain-containing sensor histidine kinase [Mesorhizobium sp.]|nr:HAMP domain-containing sensor histidine kinase [Mesorhizobium sp.]
MPLLPTLMRTTAARLSALFLLLFAICAVVLVLYLTSLSSRMLTTQTRETIIEEVQSLDRAYQRGGLALLVRTIGLRSRQPGANLYLIADPAGQILAGNVESLDPAILGEEGWTELPFTYQRYGEFQQPDAGERPAPHYAIALVMRLPNGMIALVGRDLGEPERQRDVVRQALMLAIGMTALSGLAIWFFVGRRALKRIDGMSEASRRIMEGDLSQRLPVSGSGDEFDRLSENLNAMLAKIAALNKGLKQVSDNIAHDLKTPLTRLRNRAEEAMARNDADAYRDALAATIHNSDQLIRTFNAILTISRLEAGRTSPDMLAPVSLAETVRDVLELYEALAEEKGVALVADTPTDAVVEGSRELIAQALSNLVDNAIKYARRGDGAAKVVLRLEADEREIRLSVADNGPGIPEAMDRERATERFVRLEASRTEPGSGLGLSIAKAVMTFQRGELRLAPGDPGLIVVMAFPRSRERP